MEKISGILPSNARITTVDMKNSGANRPGMPSFGREIGLSTPAEKAALQAAEASAIRHSELMSLRERSDDPHVKSIQEMSRQFFMSRKEEYDKPTLPTFTGTVADSVTVETSPLNTEPLDFDESAVVEESNSETEKDSLVRGGKLDVLA